MVSFYGGGRAGEFYAGVGAVSRVPEGRAATIAGGTRETFLFLTTGRNINCGKRRGCEPWDRARFTDRKSVV